MQLYEQLAAWWPLFSAPDEYIEEAAMYVDLIRAATDRLIVDVLELGSGGGNNALHMKQAFTLTLVEPADGMREVSRALNPTCTHLPGDMRTVRLGRTFDAVFVHDAIMYMTTEADLRAALATVAVHLAPGGVALVAPDVTAEAFASFEEIGGHDEPGGRGVRYVEWSQPPIPGTTVFDTHYAILLREPDGAVRPVHDVHRCGVFPRATWLRLFGEIGLTASIAPRTFDGIDYDTFVARHTPRP